MFQTLTLRRKLALIALAPLLALLALSVLRIQGDLSESSDASNTQSHTTVSALTGQLFEAFRNEAVSNQNAFAVAGVDEAAAQSFTDAAAQAWLGGVQGTSFAALDEAELERFLANVAAYRSRIDTAESGAEIFAIDQEVLESIERYDGLLANSAQAAGLDDAADLTTVGSAEAELQLLGLLATHTDTLPEGLPSAIGAAQNASDGFGLRTTTALPNPPETFAQLVTEFASLAPGDAVTMSDNDWRDASDERAAQIADVRSTIVSNASAAAASAQTDVDSRVRTTGLLFLIGALLAGLAIFLVGRSIRSSLDGLKDEAARVGSGDIPRIAASLRNGTPLTGFDSAAEDDELAEDEFGEVAAEIRSIRQGAARLGGEVAELQAGISDTFVNLARRNQALVDRQLEAIDTLEAEERDPDRLSLMYRVDHLATRMRRNAESLLVLADAKTPERHSPAVELREVLRVAIGEVEDYRRIVPIALDDLLVPGHRAQDLAHLLAELMENAAQQSPPGTAVDVSGGFEPTTRDYIITIRDHGTGIAEPQLSGLNELLATPATSTLTISHSIGLQVVSRLAHSLGLDARLAAGPEGGIIAAVRVPASLAAEWGVPDRPSPPVAEVSAAAPIASPVEPAPVAEAPMDLGALDLGGLDLSSPVEAPSVAAPEPDLSSFGLDPLPPLDVPAVTELPDLGTPDLADFAMPDTPDLGVAPAPAVPEFSVPEMSFDPVAPVDPLTTPTMDFGVAPTETPVDPFATPEIPDMARTPPGESIPDFGAPHAPSVDFPAATPDPTLVEGVVPAFPAVAPETPAAPVPAPIEPIVEAPLAQPLPQTQFEVPAPAPQAPVAQAPLAPAPQPLPQTQFEAPQAPAPQAPAPQPQPQPQAQAPLAPAPQPQAPQPQPQAPLAPQPQPQPQAQAPLAPAPQAPLTQPQVPQPEPTMPVAQPLAPQPQAAPVADTAPETTSAGLTKRRRSSAPVETFDAGADRTAPSQRTPDQVKNMLSRYKTGLERGRGSAGTDGES